MNRVHAHRGAANGALLVHAHPDHLNEHGNWGGPVDATISAEAHAQAELHAGSGNVFNPALIAGHA